METTNDIGRSETYSDSGDVGPNNQALPVTIKSVLLQLAVSRHHRKPPSCFEVTIYCTLKPASISGYIVSSQLAQAIPRDCAQQTMLLLKQILTWDRSNTSA